MLNENEFYQNALLSVLPVVTKKYLDEQSVTDIAKLGPDGVYDHACEISSVAINIALRCAILGSTVKDGKAYTEPE
jgi:hypothetical protein